MALGCGMDSVAKERIEVKGQVRSITRVWLL